MNKEAIKTFVEEEIWENIIWEGMEAILYSDGDTWTRQEGSAGIDEDDIIYKVPLSFYYWSDSYVLAKNEDEDLVKDESVKKYFINDMTNQIYNELA